MGVSSLELAELGLDETPAEAAACDAAAAWLLRQLGKAKLEEARRESVHRRERELLAQEQQHQLEPTRRRIADLERRIEDLARLAQRNGWFGKAKSRSTSYGAYGTRDQKERITVLDEKRAIEWARSECPTAIKTSEKLLISACSAQLLSSMKASGELPDAFEYVGADEKPFAKADVAVLAAEGGA